MPVAMPLAMSPWSPDWRMLLNWHRLEMKQHSMRTLGIRALWSTVFCSVSCLRSRGS